MEKKRWTYISVGPYIIFRRKDYPLFELADELVRNLTLTEINEMLTGKRHTHRNPSKRKAAIPDTGEKGFV